MTIEDLQKANPETLRQYLISYYQANQWELDPLINLFSFRREEGVSNEHYSDLIGAFSFSSPKIILGPGTTQPGIFYANKPLNPLGTAHVIKGFYPKVFKRGIHNKGKKSAHEAFLQVGKFSVRRDANHNGIIDVYEPLETASNQGINLHSQFGDGEDIGLWGAACSVLQHMTTLKELIKWADETKITYFNYGIILAEEI